MNPSKPKTLFILFATFFKIGLFTFGGGYAMIALIEREVVEKRAWLTHKEMLDLIAIAESTPGVIALNTATYVGAKLGGFWGSLACSIAVILPSVIIIMAITPAPINMFSGHSGGSARQSPRLFSTLSGSCSAL